jgi:transcription initiation factor TFIIH subunit 2
MLEKDLRPTRYELTLNYACEFVTEYFEQNPISQLGVIGMRDGLAVRISDLSGMPIKCEFNSRQSSRRHHSYTGST